MSDHSNFMSIVQNSSTVAERWAELVQKTVADAAEQGVTLEPDEVLNIREVRLAALGNTLNEDNYINELLALPAMSDAAKKKAIEAGDEKVRAAVLSDLNRDKTVHPDRYVDNAARRLSRARSMGVATPPAEVANAEMSKEAKLEIIRDLPPLQRLQQARKWGLAQ